jgi:2-C-methyl-D-erythritol 2,4-cyclodiphosphate synthase
MPIGLGYDSHRFTPNRPLVLGGVAVPSEQGLAGHSDADAVLHALTDAVLGAIAAGDIGEHFPDSDPQWRGADSSKFLLGALELARQRSLRPANCDITIITELPRLSACKPAIRAHIAELMGLPESAVSVKAKTNEGMGWIGRGEGLAVLAVVLMKPSPRGGKVRG